MRERETGSPGRRKCNWYCNCNRLSFFQIHFINSNDDLLSEFSLAMVRWSEKLCLSEALSSSFTPDWVKEKSFKRAKTFFFHTLFLIEVKTKKDKNSGLLAEPVKTSFWLELKKIYVQADDPHLQKGFFLTTLESFQWSIDKENFPDPLESSGILLDFARCKLFDKRRVGEELKQHRWGVVEQKFCSSLKDFETYYSREDEQKKKCGKHFWLYICFWF